MTLGKYQLAFCLFGGTVPSLGAGNVEERLERRTVSQVMGEITQIGVTFLES